MAKRHPSSDGDDWPETRSSWIDACARPGTPGAAEALEALVRAYRRCLYKYIRRHDKQPDDARDILQCLLASLTSGKIFRRYRKESGRWRFYFIGCLKKEIGKYRRSQRARPDAKARPLISRDDEKRFELELADTKGLDPEQQVNREWALDLMLNSIEAVAAELKNPWEVRILKEWAIVDPSDRPDAVTFLATFPAAAKLSVPILENHGSRLRKRLRAEMVARVAPECRTGEDPQAVLKELLDALRPPKE